MSWSFVPAHVPPEDDDYDPRCEDVATALRAIWRAYARHKSARGWYMLEEMGLRRSVYEPYFEEYDRLHIVSDHGLLNSHNQIVHFLRFLPEVRRLEVIGAALYMCGLYMSIKRTQRADYLHNGRKKA